MPKFTDNKGHTWPFEIDFPSLNRVYQLLHVDIVALPESDLLNRLASPIFFINLLYVLCKPAADAMGVTDEQFGRRCVMPLDAAVDATVAGVVDFFQSLGKIPQAKTLAAAMEMATKMEHLRNDRRGYVLTKMEELLIQAIQDETSGEQSTEQLLEPESVTSLPME